MRFFVASLFHLIGGIAREKQWFLLVSFFRVGFIAKKSWENEIAQKGGTAY